jgi:putative transposase
MPSYRRWRKEGGMFFFTLVTHKRSPLFDLPSAREQLREAIRGVRQARPFELRAMVLLPDHLHMLWRLPEGDADYSTRVALIKRRFTRAYLAGRGGETDGSSSRARHRLRGSGRSGSGSTPFAITVITGCIWTTFTPTR